MGDASPTMSFFVGCVTGRARTRRGHRACSKKTLSFCLTRSARRSIVSFCGWACSSVGQSVRLITGRSQVRALSGPPSLTIVAPARAESPLGRLLRGDVAQLGERGLCKPEVVGSIPIVSTNHSSRGSCLGFFVSPEFGNRGSGRIHVHYVSQRIRKAVHGSKTSHNL